MYVKLAQHHSFLSASSGAVIDAEAVTQVYCVNAFHFYVYQYDDTPMTQFSQYMLRVLDAGSGRGFRILGVAANVAMVDGVFTFGFEGGQVSFLNTSML